MVNKYVSYNIVSDPRFQKGGANCLFVLILFCFLRGRGGGFYQNTPRSHFDSVIS